MELIDWFYPRRCPLCHQAIRPGRSLACPECTDKLVYIREPRCKRCGKPLLSELAEYCSDCETKTRSFYQGVSLWVYTEAVQHSIFQFKYHNKREYKKFYAQQIIQNFSGHMTRWKIQVIVPVPLHKGKRRTRGFNQAELVAVELAKYYPVPVNTKSVMRVRNTKPQKDLTARDRKANLKGAFQLRDNNLYGKNVLLIDDIYTTGSTIEEISELLMKNGVSKVCFITLATGYGM